MKKIICLLFGHFKGYGVAGAEGLPVFPVGQCYDLNNDKVASYLEMGSRLGVTVDEFICDRCGEKITEKMNR